MSNVDLCKEQPRNLWVWARIKSWRCDLSLQLLTMEIRTLFEPVQIWAVNFTKMTNNKIIQLPTRTLISQLLRHITCKVPRITNFDQVFTNITRYTWVNNNRINDKVLKANTRKAKVYMHRYSMKCEILFFMGLEEVSSKLGTRMVNRMIYLVTLRWVCQKQDRNWEIRWLRVKVKRKLVLHIAALAPLLCHQL